MRERDILKAVADISARGEIATSFAIYEALDRQRRFRLRGRLEWLDAMFLGPNIGRMWIMLSRAEERGLLNSDWVEEQRPRKRAYQLTDIGRWALTGDI